MNKDKHVLPDTDDTFSQRVAKGAREKKGDRKKMTIYGPDNEPLVNVNMEVGRELTENRKKK